MSIFKSKSVTLLAREVKFDPSDSSNPIVIEGDRKGFLIWILKLLRLGDPSYRVEVSNGNLITCSGKKHFTYLPMSLLSSYSVGYNNKKIFILIAIALALFSLVTLSSAPDDFGNAMTGFILMGGLSFLFYWLYKRSGSLNFNMSLYNGEGSVTIYIQSGVTGVKVNNDDLLNAIAAAATASQKSDYFKKNI